MYAPVKSSAEKLLQIYYLFIYFVIYAEVDSYGIHVQLNFQFDILAIKFYFK